MVPFLIHCPLHLVPRRWCVLFRRRQYLTGVLPLQAVLARPYLLVGHVCFPASVTARVKGSILSGSLTESRCAACGHVAHVRNRWPTRSMRISLFRGQTAVTASAALGSRVTAMGMTRLTLSPNRTQRCVYESERKNKINNSVRHWIQVLPKWFYGFDDSVVHIYSESPPFRQ